MPSEITGVIAFFVLLFLMMLGIPLGICGLLVGVVGTMAMEGFHVLGVFGPTLFNTPADYGFTILPMFILMGGLAFSSGVASKAFDVARKWVGQFPGGLVAAVSITGALFGAVTGSSTASVATLAKIAAPDMLKAKYHPGIVTASIASIGGLAALIPPSGIMVLLGILTGTSIARLLIGGIVPGILSCIIFIIIAIVMGKIRPQDMPAQPRATWKERFKGLPQISGILLIGLTIIIPIYTGAATATEAAAFGVIAALIVALVLRTRLGTIGSEIKSTAIMTGKIFLLLIGMMVFSRFFTMTQVPEQVNQWIAALHPSVPVFLLIITVLYFILGMFMDFLSALLITLPFVWPSAMALGINPIQLGVGIALLAEIAVITPPVGLNLYVAYGIIREGKLRDAAIGITPFVFGFLLTLLLIFTIPQLSLFMPNMMSTK